MSVDGMISDTRIGYLNYYIQKTFPNYCSFISKKEFYNIINVIKENEFLKTCSFKRMKDGEFNEYIDSLVIGHMQRIVSSSVPNYDEFFNYVKLLISQRNPGLGDEFFDELSRKFVLDIVTEKNDISDSRMFAAYGRRLLDDYDKVIDRYVDVAYEWVMKIIKEHCTLLPEDVQEDFVEAILRECSIESIVDGLNMSDVLRIYNVKFEEEIQKDNSKVRRIYENNARELIERVVKINAFGLHENAQDYFIEAIFSEYTINDIVNGIDRNSIIEKFRNKQQYVADEIEKLVYNIYPKIVPMPIHITRSVIVDYMKSMTLEKGKYKVVDVLSGRHNEDIVAYCSNGKIERKEISEDEVSRYISNIIISCVRARINELTNKNIDDIYMEVVIELSKLKALPSDVINHNYDNLINDIAYKHLRRLNSKNKENVPNKMKHKPRKRNMSKTILSLALVGTIAASAVTVGNGLVNAVSNTVENVKYNTAVSQFEDRGVANTAFISTIHSDQFEDAADNVINFYLMCKENGLDDSKYFALGFNLARNQVRSNRTLAVMDSLLKEVQLKAKKIEGAYDFKEVIDDSCFLEFACEELYSMGCKEVQNDKYLVVVRAYKNAANKANPMNDETPWDYLSEDDRQMAEELMDLYESYTKKYVIEANELLKNARETDDFVVFLAAQNGTTSRKNGG